MEKNHHLAKATTCAHTQHGGGIKKISAIIQQYQHWYRNIQHRYATRKKVRELQSIVTNPEGVAATEKRRVASNASTAREAHERWRASRRRVGSIWKEHEEETMVVDAIVDHPVDLVDPIETER